MRLASVDACCLRTPSAAETFPASRRARTAWTRPTCLPSSADDDPPARVDLALQLVRRVGDLALGEVLLDRLDHAAELVDPGEVRVGGALHLVGERLHEVGAA